MNTETVSSSRLRVDKPLAIAMWDFSWLERRWPGAGYEDWNVALDSLVERGYNAVRIDAYPHFLAADPHAARTLTPCWTTELWGSPHRVTVSPWPALPDFIRACAARDVRVALSTWWREDADRLAHRILGAKGLAHVWLRTLELLEKEGLLEQLLYVDLSNEWPTSVWTPFYQPSPPATQEMWDSLEPMSLMREAIGRLRERFPSLPFTFSTCTREEAWLSVEDASFLDLADHHLWMSSMEFYRRIDYKFEVFSEEGPHPLRSRSSLLAQRADPTHRHPCRGFPSHRTSSRQHGRLVACHLERRHRSRVGLAPRHRGVCGPACLLDRALRRDLHKQFLRPSVRRHVARSRLASSADRSH